MQVEETEFYRTRNGNVLGDLIGVMQTNAYSLTAQYKRAGKAGVICVEVELPKAITVDVAR